MKYKLYEALFFVIELVLDLAFASLLVIAATILSVVVMLRVSWVILVGNQDPQLICGVAIRLIKLMWRFTKDHWVVGIMHLDDEYYERVHKEIEDITFLK